MAIGSILVVSRTASITVVCKDTHAQWVHVMNNPEMNIPYVMDAQLHVICLKMHMWEIIYKSFKSLHYWYSTVSLAMTDM